ncbi:hypothetical protein EVAR_27237_1 [Eumeta japonica]|uniref:Uncharacterized protein n=1 Tax=Eumeta variegata TaxID=151549 RepID=A0A4C1VY78_EUMVA|nr:hypothetical protein EVAR_27237_1 [Eumeta japonica]
MKLSVCLYLAALCAAASHARHVHPKLGDDALAEEFARTSTERMLENQSAVPDLTKLKVSWFVPVNNKFFFRSEAPCEPGYKRDASGVCREVWD